MEIKHVLIIKLSILNIALLASIIYAYVTNRGGSQNVQFIE